MEPQILSRFLYEIRKIQQRSHRLLLTRFILGLVINCNTTTFITGSALIPLGLSWWQAVICTFSFVASRAQSDLNLMQLRHCRRKPYSPGCSSRQFRCGILMQSDFPSLVDRSGACGVPNSPSGTAYFFL